MIAIINHSCIPSVNGFVHVCAFDLFSFQWRKLPSCGLLFANFCWIAYDWRARYTKVAWARVEHPKTVTTCFSWRYSTTTNRNTSSSYSPAALRKYTIENIPFRPIFKAIVNRHFFSGLFSINELSIRWTCWGPSLYSQQCRFCGFLSLTVDDFWWSISIKCYFALKRKINKVNIRKHIDKFWELWFASLLHKFSCLC